MPCKIRLGQASFSSWNHCQTGYRSPLCSGSHQGFCRAETDRCLVFGNLSVCVPDRRPFYLYDDAKNCGTDGEATGSGRETGAAHGGTFP